MAHVALTMNASAVPGMEEKCEGCFRPFRRGERMNAVLYDADNPAGWHCDQCLEDWKTKGEGSLPRWNTKQNEEP